MKQEFTISMTVASPNLCQLLNAGRLADRTLHNLWEATYKTEYKLTEPDLYPELGRNPVNKLTPHFSHEKVSQDNLSRIIHAQSTTRIERMDDTHATITFDFTNDDALLDIEGSDGKRPHLRNALFESCLSVLLHSAHTLAINELEDEDDPRVIGAYAEIEAHLKDMALLECGHSGISEEFALYIDGEQTLARIAH